MLSPCDAKCNNCANGAKSGSCDSLSHQIKFLPLDSRAHTYAASHDLSHAPWCVSKRQKKWSGGRGKSAAKKVALAASRESAFFMHRANNRINMHRSQCATLFQSAGSLLFLINSLPEISHCLLRRADNSSCSLSSLKNNYLILL